MTATSGTQVDCKITLAIQGAICAVAPQTNIRATLEIVGDRIGGIFARTLPVRCATAGATIDLSGFLVMPGLINAHDHLEFALHPRLADPPYRNYIDWGEDVHKKFPEIIAMYGAVPKNVRLWWGGIRNLLCGVTTVGHHNPLWPELQMSEFPVRVVQEYGWGHSLALGGDLRKARGDTPEGRPFILHACEGIDEQAHGELRALDNMGLLDAETVLVHGLAMDKDGVERMIARKSSLIVCPSSNYFLYGSLPDLSVLGRIERLALGNDSPLTAAGDLLDEIQFAIRSCGISALRAYDMVTRGPASIFHLEYGEGAIAESGVADLIAVRDMGTNAAGRMESLSMEDVEFVMIAGRVQLASPAVFERVPQSARKGLVPLSVNGVIRWLRAPVNDLLQAAEEVLGKGEVRLRNKRVQVPVFAEAEHAF